jgi:hypothetical protein
VDIADNVINKEKNTSKDLVTVKVYRENYPSERPSPVPLQKLSYLGKIVVSFIGWPSIALQMSFIGTVSISIDHQGR